ncbi:hypothetical protein [Kiloniella sp. EL199]|uniref:hypothetical protein n=1 Tax=Kiloniella sp. EL199 TaxID=2107581 RepID=UPI000EA1C590|nr:hypothetical protein [Kiloniella sp. EL199]
MGIPRIVVDFNELIESDLVLLSQTDVREDASKNLITLYEGMEVIVFVEDCISRGDLLIKCNLIANGVVEKNSGELYPYVKWCCRINEKGIYYENEEWHRKHGEVIQC